MTAIGLPVKRVLKKNTTDHDNSTLNSFINLSVKNQIKKILGWVIRTHDIIDKVINKYQKITITDIREKLPDSLLDDEVNFHCVYEYFEKAAIHKLKQTINKKKTFEIIYM